MGHPALCSLPCSAPASMPVKEESNRHCLQGIVALCPTWPPFVFLFGLRATPMLLWPRGQISHSLLGRGFLSHSSDLSMQRQFQYLDCKNFQKLQCVLTLWLWWKKTNMLPVFNSTLCCEVWNKGFQYDAGQRKQAAAVTLPSDTTPPFQLLLLRLCTRLTF